MNGESLAYQVLELATPPPDLTVREWSDEYRYIASGFTEPGKWRTDRAPYQAEIMDCITDLTVKELWVKKSSQVGWTEIINNAVGYYCTQNPLPMMIIQPTLDMAETWSKNRLKRMVESTPVVKEALGDPKSRIAGNTLLYKEFPGGYVWICGANSPASLASNPIPVVICDETDRYPASAGDEGDPISIAKARSLTFWNKRFIAGSTPTIKGVSRIDKGYDTGDQRSYHIACKSCGTDHTMEWEYLDFSKKGSIEEPLHICPHCGHRMRNHEKHERMKKESGARWIGAHKFRGIASFRINALYSPWATFAEMVDAFLKAKKGGSQTIKTWKNTWLGESYEETGETVEVEQIMEREAYRQTSTTGEAILPNSILTLTAGIDVQDDRIECEIVGWGLGEESWSIAYEIRHGSPRNPMLHEEIDEILQSRWKREDGIELSIPIACIDSGDGDWTKYIYDFCLQRMRRSKGAKYPNRGVLPIKGASMFSAPIIKEPALPKKGKPNVQPWIVGSSQAKIVVMDRLRLMDTGPGFCHFPDHYEKKYFEGLTAEKLMTKYSKGFPQKEWHKARQYNEPLDCRVYNIAAIRILNPDLEAIAAKYKAAANKEKLENHDKQPQNKSFPQQKRRKMRKMRLNFS